MFRRMPGPGLSVFLCAASCFLYFSHAGVSGAKALQEAAASGKWNLIWSDEFNGPEGSMPDPAKWSFVVGGSGFGNNELEYYTDRAINVHQEKGNLVVAARKEAYAGKDGLIRAYTSARIQTKGHFEQRYGRMEARIRVPKGQGIWPAFWMMGNDMDSAGWPACGELDIMENVGYEPSIVHGTLHGPGYSGGDALTSAYTLPDRMHFSDDFHVFAAEWEPGEIRFYVDDKLFATRKADSMTASQRWVFDHPFFLLLNVAVGGNWPGKPDATTKFPVTMLVDYVRVYSRPMSASQTAPQ
jgi:beta-glucanase (GH16 family)